MQVLRNVGRGGGGGRGEWGGVYDPGLLSVTRGGGVVSVT